MIGRNTNSSYSSFRGRTGNRRPGALRTNLQQLFSGRADGKWQWQSGPRLRHVFGDATPDRLNRHPVIGGVQQVDHAGFRVVPQCSRQRFFWGDFAQSFRVPMRQCNRASHCRIGVIFYQKFNWLRSGCARNYA